MPSVSIVIPAFNEERGLPSVLECLKQSMDSGEFEYEILVVDDGSSDGTGVVASRYDFVTVKTHRRNLGYGAALKTGIRNARHDIVCITDADGTYPNEPLLELVARVHRGECDMAVGSRNGKNVSIPVQRRFAKWVIGRLANMVIGYQIPDLNSGLRAFRRETALRFFNLLPDGFSFTTTITLAMLSNGYAVDYLPIDYLKRIGKSKIRPIHDTLYFVQLILRMALYFAPLKVFLPLSAGLFFLAVAVGWSSWYFTGRVADVSTLVIAMTSIQSALIGLVAELINQRTPSNYRGD
jgi:glycosyltransferase involved in cell wall biosynthesis